MYSRLKIDLCEQEFKNPVMVASGTFGYGTESDRIIDVKSFGAIITKSITRKPRQGNRPPRIAETGSGMLNSIGLANVGIENFISDKLPELKNIGTKTFVNIAGSTPDEYIEILEKLEEQPGISGYEINLSCPNVKEGGLEFGRSTTSCFNITGDLRKRTNRVLMVKLTPNITFISDIGKSVEAAGADCISAINTLVGMDIDINSRKPLLSTITGGYSGPAIKPVALAKVYELYKNVNIPIIGIGGIMDWHDIIKFFLVGASAVQLGTVNFINPQAINEILTGLQTYCVENKLARISELTGAMNI